jgi:putative oxidoreductase
MLGAIGMVHAKVGFFMNWTGKQAGEGFEYHLLAMRKTWYQYIIF